MAFLISGKTPRLDTEITIHTTTDPEKGITDGSFSSECSTPTSSSSESSQERLDKDIVNWDGLYDPENPVNFSCLAKFTNVGIVTTLTFITQLASSMLAPGVPELMAEFGSSSSLLASFVVSVYVLGFAVGPLVLAPGSELVGRKVIYDICNVGFTVFSAACAVSGNLGMLIVFRFLQGCFGSAPLTNGGGTIADLIVQEKRGGVLALYALGIFLGPVIGPVAGGYLVAAQGWRWVLWVLTIIEGILTLLSFLFLRETYPPVLLKRKTQHLIKKTRNTNLRPKCDNINSHNRRSSQLFIQAIARPTKMLLFSPIVSALSIYGGILYGYQYLMFTTFTSVFQTQYHFPTKSSGLSFLGIGIGALFGLLIIGIISDRIVKAKSKPTPSSPSGGTMKPEYRLPPLLIGALFTPIGLFLYGWAAEYKMHWVVPEIGTALVGVGNVAAFVCIMGYVIDAFGVYAASALAAIMVVRSIMGALLPLAGQRMYDVLGLGWGNSLLGFIAVACIPVPWALLRYGERMRMSFDVRRLE